MAPRGEEMNGSSRGSWAMRLRRNVIPRPKGGEPWHCRAEGSTRAEAIEQLSPRLSIVGEAMSSALLTPAASGRLQAVHPLARVPRMDWGRFLLDERQARSAHYRRTRLRARSRPVSDLHVFDTDTRTWGHLGHSKHTGFSSHSGTSPGRLGPPRLPESLWDRGARRQSAQFAFKRRSREVSPSARMLPGYSPGALQGFSLAEDAGVARGACRRTTRHLSSTRA